MAHNYTICYYYSQMILINKIQSLKPQLPASHKYAPTMFTSTQYLIQISTGLSELLYHFGVTPPTYQLRCACPRFFCKASLSLSEELLSLFSSVDILIAIYLSTPADNELVVKTQPSVFCKAQRVQLPNKGHKKVKQTPKLCHVALYS